MNIDTCELYLNTDRHVTYPDIPGDELTVDAAGTEFRGPSFTSRMNRHLSVNDTILNY